MDFLSPLRVLQFQSYLMKASESDLFPSVTMSPSKADRLMPRNKISVYLVTVLIAMLCTPAEANDTPVS